MGPNPTRGCVDWVRSPFYPVPRQNFGSTSPLFSRYTSRQIAERMCSGEQWGGATEILSQNGVEHGEHTQSTHPRAVHGKRWTIRKSCGDKYAIECIFIDATLSDGRPRLRDLMWKFNLVTWKKVDEVMELLLTLRCRGCSRSKKGRSWTNTSNADSHSTKMEYPKSC